VIRLQKFGKTLTYASQRLGTGVDIGLYRMDGFYSRWLRCQ
jgi:hypothetical protein